MKKMLRNGVQLGQLIEYSIPHIDTYVPYALGKEYPNSLRCSQETINLPVHSYMEETHLFDIAKWIIDDFGGGKKYADASGCRK
jgi:dTDP-4-amino-4,6-dideoxygalactose transaminase